MQPLCWKRTCGSSCMLVICIQTWRSFIWSAMVSITSVHGLYTQVLWLLLICRNRRSRHSCSSCVDQGWFTNNPAIIFNSRSRSLHPRWFVDEQLGLRYIRWMYRVYHSIRLIYGLLVGSTRFVTFGDWKFAVVEARPRNKFPSYIKAANYLTYLRRGIKTFLFQTTFSD